MPRRSSLDREKRLLSLFLTALLLLVGTGLTIFIDQGQSYAVQLWVLLHLLVALPWVVIFAYYLFIHFKRTLGSRKLGLNASGVLLSLLFAGIVASGTLLWWYGFRQQLSFWHAILAASLLGLFVLHGIQSRFANKNNEKAQRNLPHIHHRVGVKASCLSFFIMGITLLPLLWLGPNAQQHDLFQKTTSIEGTENIPLERYKTVYGENPFAPSHTTTVQQQFIALDTIAGSKNCSSCHVDIYAQWKSSVHRYAAADPSYVRNVNVLEKEKGISATRYCEGCHAPIALLTGELTPGGKHGGTPNTPAFDEGVSCQSCHSISHINNTEGVASYHFNPTKPYVFGLSSSNPIIRSLNKILIEVAPQAHKKALMNVEQQTAQFCASCHAQFMDERMNDWGWVKMQDEYSAWLDSPYSGHHEKTYSNNNKQRCQDCHMPMIDSPEDPAANANGQVSSHRFLGGNTFVAQHFGETEQLEKTIEFLQQNKMRISIEEPRRKDRLETQLTVDLSLKQHNETPYFAYLNEILPLNILVSNVGIGHDFPAGTIDLNEVWLHLEVLDAQGHTMFMSGATNDGGTVDKQAHFYKAIPINRQGKQVWRHDLFNMTGEAYRNVIKAGQTDRVEYKVTIPSWVKSPITIYATLKYRKLNKRYSDWVMQGNDYQPIPIIDMARASLSIPVRKEVPVY